MNKEEFEAFARNNAGDLPLYFKDFVFRETFTMNTQGKALNKLHFAARYATDKCRTTKPFKAILRTKHGTGLF